MLLLLQPILKTYFQINTIIISLYFLAHISLLYFHCNFIYLLINKIEIRIMNINFLINITLYVINQIKIIYKCIYPHYYQLIFLFYYHHNKLNIYHNLKSFCINYMRKNSFYKYSSFYQSITN